MKLSIIDRFGEFILKMPIVERASERIEKIGKIKDLSDPLNTHLIKLYLFQNSRDRMHWKDEVEGYLYKISKYSFNKNKKFDIEDYHRWLFEDFYMEDSTLNHNFLNIKIKKLKRQYFDEKTIENINIDEMVNLMEYFYKRICVHLQKNFNGEEIYETLDEFFDID